MGSSDVELGKIRAAEEACKLLEEVSEGVKVLGLGTGSTVKKFVEMCFHAIKSAKVVASSPDTAIHAKTYNLEVLDLLSVDSIDVYVDGADEVSKRLDLVKGRGAALFREKTLAYMSQVKIYVVDYTKYTGYEYLCVRPIPVEIVPAALNYVVKSIRKGGLFEPVIRTGSGKDGPVVTDNGNYVVDLRPAKPIVDPGATHYELKRIHGVVETGIFPSDELVDIVVVGYPDKVSVLKRASQIKVA